MNELSISKQYPASKYNLLGNTDVMVKVPEIKTPVIQAIQLDPVDGHGDVYIQQHATDDYTDKRGKYHPATPDKYAITKNGLKKLADGAGIKMITSEHVMPTTCQKCSAINANLGKFVQCGACPNKDVAYHVVISVPQLTGEDLLVDDTHEIIVENATVGMTEKQIVEFMRHLPQICEAKALNGAIRTALHIKGTYLKEELEKPFVVAYLVPNLNHAEVKEAAINSMFESSTRLFGKRAPKTVQQIETQVPEFAAIAAADEGDYDRFIDVPEQQPVVYDTPDPAPKAYQAPAPAAPVQAAPPVYDNPPAYAAPPQAAPDPASQGRRQGAGFRCADCGADVPEKVFNYSYEKFGRPLCYRCQDAEKQKRGWTR